MNHDGKTSGLTVPSGTAQRALILNCLSDAGIQPEHIGYVEAHGTGTALGDPIELHALADRFPGARRQPLMLVSVEGPGDLQGEVLKTLMQRRGIIVGTTEDEGFVRIDAHVPLAEMFGYANVLRSATAGKAEFTMEFARYAPAPTETAEALRKEYLDKRAQGK